MVVTSFITRQLCCEGTYKRNIRNVHTFLVQPNKLFEFCVPQIFKHWKIWPVIVHTLTFQWNNKFKCKNKYFNFKLATAPAEDSLMICPKTPSSHRVDNTTNNKYHLTVVIFKFTFLFMRYFVLPPSAPNHTRSNVWRGVARRSTAKKNKSTKAEPQQKYCSPAKSRRSFNSVLSCFPLRTNVNLVDCGRRVYQFNICILEIA